jgi:hypothetical protein
MRLPLQPNEDVSSRLKSVYNDYSEEDRFILPAVSAANGRLLQGVG